MPISLSRRDVGRRAVLLASVTGIAGCSRSDGGDIPPGSLVLENDHTRDHTVHVTVTRTSPDPADAASGDRTPAPATTPAGKQTYTFDLGARIVKERLVDEPGAYYVRAELETPTERDDAGSVWAAFHDADGGVSGGYVQVWIQGNGYVTVSHIRA